MTSGSQRGHNPHGPLVRDNPLHSLRRGSPLHR
jgi:hypothetical protein